MLKWSFVFLIIAVVSGVLAFTGNHNTGVATIFFCLSSIVFVITFLHGITIGKLKL